jgi:hypothetical protein
MPSRTTWIRPAGSTVVSRAAPSWSRDIPRRSSFLPSVMTTTELTRCGSQPFCTAGYAASTVSYSPVPPSRFSRMPASARCRSPRRADRGPIGVSCRYSVVPSSYLEKIHSPTPPDVHPQVSSIAQPNGGYGRCWNPVRAGKGVRAGQVLPQCRYRSGLLDASSPIVTCECAMMPASCCFDWRTSPSRTPSRCCGCYPSEIATRTSKSSPLRHQIMVLLRPLASRDPVRTSRSGVAGSTAPLTPAASTG